MAAPFDLRKGLKNIPYLLNPLKNNIDILYIFGKPRCSVEDFNMFFKSLEIDHIIYFPYITYEKLINIYKESKFLLFPSLNEGLGIPLIEAQICGCRVVTSNIEPMNTLGVKGYHYLYSDLNQNINVMKEMLNEDFEYDSLSEESRKCFSLNNISEIINVK